MPASWQARATRTAISPRLAISTFCRGLISGTEADYRPLTRTLRGALPRGAPLRQTSCGRENPAVTAGDSHATQTDPRPKTSWLPLVALAIAQFVMVLDQSAMNVSISTLVDDFDTTVTTIQAVITLYCLVMAMFMLTGGKIGDIIGRRRAFVVGLVIYACGSAITALAPTVAVLTLGWSILEGLGAALVLPAMVALIAGNFEGSSRKVAYAVIGGVAGAGIAVGPILGGWATTEYSWRIIFAGEVVFVALILVMTPKVVDAVRTGPAPKLDIVGSPCPPRAWGSSSSGCCSRARGAGSSPRTTRR